MADTVESFPIIKDDSMVFTGDQLFSGLRLAKCLPRKQVDLSLTLKTYRLKPGMWGWREMAQSVHTQNRHVIPVPENPAPSSGFPRYIHTGRQNSYTYNLKVKIVKSYCGAPFRPQNPSTGDTEMLSKHFLCIAVLRTTFTTISLADEALHQPDSSNLGKLGRSTACRLSNAQLGRLHLQSSQRFLQLLLILISNLILAKAVLVTPANDVWSLREHDVLDLLLPQPGFSCVRFTPLSQRAQ